MDNFAEYRPFAIDPDKYDLKRAKVSKIIKLTNYILNK